MNYIFIIIIGKLSEYKREISNNITRYIITDDNLTCVWSDWTTYLQHFCIITKNLKNRMFDLLTIN